VRVGSDQHVANRNEFPSAGLEYLKITWLRLLRERRKSICSRNRRQMRMGTI